MKRHCLIVYGFFRTRCDLPGFVPIALCKEYIRTQSEDYMKLMADIARYIVPIRPGRQDQRNLRVKGFPGFVYRVAA